MKFFLNYKRSRPQLDWTKLYSRRVESNKGKQLRKHIWCTHIWCTRIWCTKRATKEVSWLLCSLRNVLSTNFADCSSLNTIFLSFIQAKKRLKPKKQKSHFPKLQIMLGSHFWNQHVVNYIGFWSNWDSVWETQWKWWLITHQKTKSVTNDWPYCISNAR